MVQSKINMDVNYQEKNEIYKKDDETESFLYSYPISGFECIICLGNINYDYADKKILYIRIYSCVNETIDEQIGVFEFKPSDNIEDNDGDIDLTKLDTPLLYSFVTKKYLKARFPEETEDKEEDDSDVDMKSEYDDDPIDLSDDVDCKERLKEIEKQYRDEFDQIKQKFSCEKIIKDGIKTNCDNCNNNGDS